MGPVTIALRELGPQNLLLLSLGEPSFLLSLPRHPRAGSEARGGRIENSGLGVEDGSRGRRGGREVNRPLGLGNLPGPALATGTGPRALARGLAGALVAVGSSGLIRGPVGGGRDPAGAASEIRAVRVIKGR
jgi:hypothetical protein